VRHRASEDEATRLDARDLVDRLAAPRVDQGIDGDLERPGIAQFSTPSSEPFRL